MKKNPENIEITPEKVRRIELQFERFCYLRGKVLDIGCGGDREISYANRQSKEYEYFGIDPFVPANANTFYFTKAVAENLPLKERSFDRVIFATSLDHVSDIEKSLAEAKRVLKDDGALCIWQGLQTTLRYRLKRLFYKGTQKIKDRTLITYLISNLKLRAGTGAGISMTDVAEDDEFTHPYQFNTNSELNALLKENGFEVVEAMISDIDYPLNCFIKIKKQ